MTAFEFAGRALSFFLILVSGLTLTIGINFSLKSDSGFKARRYFLFFGISCAIWAFCYGAIGLLADEKWFYIIRRIGLLGVDGFILTDFFVVTELAGIKRIYKHPANTIVGVLAVIDWILFSRENVDTVVKLDYYTTWVGNACAERVFHNIFSATLTVVMVSIGIWVIRQSKTRRRKAFILSFFIANVVFVLCSIPDTFVVVDSEHAFPTSALGSSLCLLMLRVCASKYNAFDISLGNLFDTIYNFVDIGIMVFDPDHKLFLINPYGQRVTLAEIGEGLSASDIFDLEDISEDDLFSNSGIGDESEKRVKIRANGRICSVKTSTAIDKYNEPYCYLMVVRDVTKEEQVLDQLQAANAAKNIFLTSMSHEIRTPINTVLGMNEMILRESHDSSITAFAKDVQKSGKLLLSLVNDILDYSKIESGKMDLLPGRYELKNVVSEVMSIISSRTQKKELGLKLSVNPEIPSVLYGDEIRINQIILNLLTNAVKYTDEGIITFKLDYEEMDEEKIRLILSVQDTGRGIRKEDMNVLFESFNRVKEHINRNIEGTGLGLSITKGFVDLMGGEIDVESVYRAGSRFTVKIPQKVLSYTPVGDIHYKSDEIIGNSAAYEELFRAPDAKILVVDDVEMNCKLVMHLLKKTEMRIDMALSGQQAIKMTRLTKYDLILMDHMMPGMDGFECLAKIRSDEENPNREIPILALTANAIAGVRDTYIEAGFAEYLTKPIEGRKLEKAIMDFLPEELLI